MRVTLYIPRQLSDDTDGAARAFIAELRTALEQREDVEIVEQNADVVHLMGCWSKEADREMQRCQKLRIPVVYSTLGGLAPWTLRSHRSPLVRQRQRKTISSAALLQVWGPEEHREIARRKWTSKVEEVRNSATAIDFSTEDLGAAMVDIYNKVATVHDKAVWIGIDSQLNDLMEGAEDDAKAVCRQLLYAHYYLKRGELPEVVLRELAQTMLHAEYDEADFAEDLKALGILDFTARLEQLMAESAGLTEGFMPIEAINDKKTERMRKTITQHDIPH